MLQGEHEIYEWERGTKEIIGNLKKIGWGEKEKKRIGEMKSWEQYCKVKKNYREEKEFFCEEREEKKVKEMEKGENNYYISDCAIVNSLSRKFIYLFLLY